MGARRPNVVLAFQEQGLGLIALLLIAFVVTAGVVGALAVIVVLQKAHPHEETAKFLPSDTQIYFSLNLRPGSGQLRKARDLWERFDQHPQFLPNLDDWVDRVESDTGIDFMEGVNPWLGPEIGVGVVDVVGSAVAIGAGGVPLVAVLVGTTDSALAQNFLEDLVGYQEKDQGFSFDTESYRESTLFTESSGLQNYAVSDHYLVFSTDIDLLQDTIDRIQDGGDGASLYTSSGFKEVRQTLPKERFFSAYADLEKIWQDARRQFGAQIPDAARQQLEELVPDWLAITGSFLDMGLQVEMITPINNEPDQGPFGANSLAAAKLIPSDTLAFLSFKVRPDLTPIRDELSGQKIADLGPDFASALPLLLDTEFDQQTNLEELLDILLRDSTMPLAWI